MRRHMGVIDNDVEVLQMMTSKWRIDNGVEVLQMMT